MLRLFQGSHQRLSNWLPPIGLTIGFAIVGTLSLLVSKSLEGIETSDTVFGLAMIIQQVFLFPTLFICAFLVASAWLRDQLLLLRLLITVVSVGLTFGLIIVMLRLFYDVDVKQNAFYIVDITARSVGMIGMATLFRFASGQVLVPWREERRPVARQWISRLLEFILMLLLVSVAQMYVATMGNRFAYWVTVTEALLITYLVCRLFRVFLTDRPISIFGGVAAFLGAWVVSSIYCGWFAWQKPILSKDAGSVITFLASSIFGAIVILVCVGVCFFWLRGCGWRCIKRGES